jgi:ABC-2 type transport system permease protein
MLRDPFFKGLRDLRRSFPWWAVGVAILPIWLCLMYPSVKESSAGIQSYIENLPEAFRNMFVGEGADYASPVGFMDSEIMSFMSPILFMVFAIGLAVRQIAGEEEHGTLSLLLSYPVSRTRLLAQKLGVVFAGVAALTAVHLLSMIAGVAMVDEMDLGMGKMLAGHVYLGLLTMAVAAIAFALGAATGKRGLSIGVATAVGAGSYLVNALAPLSNTLEPLQKVSLFHYYGGAQPLATGLKPGYVAILLGVTVVSAAAAFVGFARRDVRV